MTMGRSGSPSIKATPTSVPPPGLNSPPHRLPAPPLPLPAARGRGPVPPRAAQGSRRLGRFHPPLRAILRLRCLARQRRPVKHRAVGRSAMFEDRILVNLEVLAGHIVVIVAQADLAGSK